MLTAFEMDDQRYERAGCYFYQTKANRRCKLIVWRTKCPDCGAQFTYCTKAGHNPCVHYYRRCEACRRGPSRRVSRERHAIDSPRYTNSASVPRRWGSQQGRALLEPPRPHVSRSAHLSDGRAGDKMTDP